MEGSQPGQQGLDHSGWQQNQGRDAPDHGCKAGGLTLGVNSIAAGRGAVAGSGLLVEGAGFCEATRKEGA